MLLTQRSWLLRICWLWSGLTHHPNVRTSHWQCFVSYLLWDQSDRKRVKWMTLTMNMDIEQTSQRMKSLWFSPKRSNPKLDAHTNLIHCPIHVTVSPTCCVLGGRTVQSRGEEAGAACTEAGGGAGGPVHLVMMVISKYPMIWGNTDLVWRGRHPPPSVSITPELYQQSAIWKQREISILIKVNIVHWTTTYICRE